MGVLKGLTASLEKSHTARDEVLRRPDSFRDKSWGDRIERAREARTAARTLRRGKPATYPNHLTQP